MIFIQVYLFPMIEDGARTFLSYADGHHQEGINLPNKDNLYRVSYTVKNRDVFVMSWVDAAPYQYTMRASGLNR